jgi:hypothetical protein
MPCAGVVCLPCRGAQPAEPLALCCAGCEQRRCRGAQRGPVPLRRCARRRGAVWVRALKPATKQCVRACVRACVRSSSHCKACGGRSLTNGCGALGSARPHAGCIASEACIAPDDRALDACCKRLDGCCLLHRRCDCAGCVDPRIIKLSPLVLRQYDEIAYQHPYRRPFFHTHCRTRQLQTPSPPVCAT